MILPFKHLTKTDRLRIERWQRQGVTTREIANKLRVHISTIYRELHRGEYERLNGATWETETAYSPDIADERYRDNLRVKGAALKIGNDRTLADYLESMICDQDYSPAAAIAQARLEGKLTTSISAQTLYSYIHKGVFLRLTMANCPRKGKHKSKYTHVKKEAVRAPAGESIDKRPAEIETREVFGHWEMDTVYSAKQKSRAVLLTLTERKTRKEIVTRLPDRKEDTIVRAIDALERKFGATKFRAVFRSITVDNGSEFAASDLLERSALSKNKKRTQIYYAHPYSSWERGSNENQNGMLRRKFPKGTVFSRVTAKAVSAAADWLNNYPRKIFDFRTSEMLYAEELRALGYAA